MKWDLHQNDSNGILGEKLGENNEFEYLREGIIEQPGHKIGEDDKFEYYEEIEEECVNLAVALNIQCKDISEPQSYREAMNRPDSEMWKEAMNEEFDAHDKCATWSIVKQRDLLPQAAIIKARWVSKIKTEANGTKRYKSHLVAKGFADRNFYDGSEIYAPVVRLSDVRFVLIIANKLNLTLKQCNIRTAFLNGSLQKTMYMELPEGLRERMTQVKDFENFERDHVCKLNRSLYGLKVSPK